MVLYSMTEYTISLTIFRRYNHESFKKLLRYRKPWSFFNFLVLKIRACNECGCSYELIKKLNNFFSKTSEITNTNSSFYENIVGDCRTWLMASPSLKIR